MHVSKAEIMTADRTALPIKQPYDVLHECEFPFSLPVLLEDGGEVLRLAPTLPRAQHLGVEG